MTLEILFEDNHLLICNKPAGLLTQPSLKNQESLETEAKKYIKETKSKKGLVYLHAVHRLDRLASGIVVFAKTKKALSRLNVQIRNKEWKKTYYALVEGIPPKNEGVLEHYLLHGKFCAEINEKGKLSTLHYQVLENNYLSLLEITLETGRYHQIRAQLASIDCPIVGDSKYGSKRSVGNFMCLHHSCLTFTHPTLKKTLTIRSEVPSQWKKLE